MPIDDDEWEFDVFFHDDSPTMACRFQNLYTANSSKFPW